MDRVLLSNQMKTIEKHLVGNTKKLQELREVINTVEQDAKTVSLIKDEIRDAKSTGNIVEEVIGKSTILKNSSKFHNDFFDIYNTLSKETTNTVKELHNFFEGFRTHRIYFLQEQKIERFLSGFLNNFSEDFLFKPEYAGVIDLKKLAEIVEGTKENATIKIKYEKIPRMIKEAYNLKLKKFIIESHKLKLLFKENFVIEVFANNNMIHKIDKIAKENNITFE